MQDHKCECKAGPFTMPGHGVRNRCIECGGIVVLTQDEALEALDKDLESIFAADPGEASSPEDIEREHRELVHADGSECPDGCGGE